MVSLRFLADLHAGHALIPALDDLTRAQGELERLAPSTELSNLVPLVNQPV